MYFVSDIDGTLLAQPGDRVVDGLPEALNSLKGANIDLVLASSRTLHDITLAADRFNLGEYYAISSGGRMVTKMNASRTVETIYENHNVSQGVYLARTGYKVIFQDSVGGLNYIAGCKKPNAIWSEVFCLTEQELLSSKPTSFILEFEGSWEDAVRYAGNRWHPWKFNNRVYLQEMSHDKGMGLSQLISHRPRNRIVAVGDDVNDIPMFALADVSYVMANASTGLISGMTKPFVGIPSVEDGGAIRAIEEVLAQKLGSQRRR